MDDKNKILAKYFTICIEYNCLDRAELFLWTDNLIANGCLDNNIIEISSSKDTKNIKPYLNNYSEGISEKGIYESVIYKLVIENKTNYIDLNKMLRCFWHNKIISEDLIGLFYQFDHFIDDGCLSNGYVTEDEVLDLIDSILDNCKKEGISYLIAKKSNGT